MKNSTLIKTGCVLLVLIGGAGRSSAQTYPVKAANEWVKSRVWSNGVTVTLYQDVNSIEFYYQYSKSKDLWDKAFAFLADKQKLDTLKPGTYPVAGKDVYAVITEGPEKTTEAAKWESHRKYTDLQYVIRGEEKIGVAPIANAAVIISYSDDKDAANYTADGNYYIATPGEFYLFFPSDVHKPNMHVEGYDMVKKLVIKIRYVQ